MIIQSTTNTPFRSTVKAIRKDKKGALQAIIHGFKDDVKQDVICKKHTTNMHQPADFDKLKEGVTVECLVLKRGNSFFASGLKIVENDASRQVVQQPSIYPSSKLAGPAMDKNDGRELQAKGGNHDAAQKGLLASTMNPPFSSTVRSIGKDKNGALQAIIHGFKDDVKQDVICKKHPVNMHQPADFEKLKEGMTIECSVLKRGNSFFASGLKIVEADTAPKDTEILVRSEIIQDYSKGNVNQMLVDFISSIESSIQHCINRSGPKKGEEFEEYTNLVLKLLCGAAYTHGVPADMQRSMPDGYMYLKDLFIIYDATLEDKIRRDKNKNEQKTNFVNQIAENSDIKIENTKGETEIIPIINQRQVWFITKDSISSQEEKRTVNGKQVIFKEVSIFELIALLKERTVKSRADNEIKSLTQQLLSLGKD
jgi:hypothetical protein